MTLVIALALLIAFTCLVSRADGTATPATTRAGKRRVGAPWRSHS